jgi:hypothetical protein
MSNLNTRASVHPLWSNWAGAVLDGFATVVISIFAPNSLQADDFNWYTNQGSTPPTLLWTGPAQMQVFRQTLNADSVAGSVVQVRSARFTVNKGEGPATRISEGMVVRVTEVGEDVDLLTYEFTVTSGVNADLAFRRTIEAEVNMAVSVTPITGAV